MRVPLLGAILAGLNGSNAAMPPFPQFIPYGPVTTAAWIPLWPDRRSYRSHAREKATRRNIAQIGLRPTRWTREARVKTYLRRDLYNAVQ